MAVFQLEIFRQGGAKGRAFYNGAGLRPSGSLPTWPKTALSLYAATPSKNAASQNLPFSASLNTGPWNIIRSLDFPAYDKTMTAKSQAMESGQHDTPTPAAYRSY